MTTEAPADDLTAKEIGGYLGLDLPPSGTNPHPDAIALNSARNALLYVLLARSPRKVHLPSYICGSMLQPLQHAGVEPSFYAIDERLEIVEAPLLHDGELLLYVNYFGIKSAYCERLAARYGAALLVDNSQAYYAPPSAGSATLYSPRKFVGVPDGGYLYLQPDPALPLEQDVSSEATRHLLGRVDESASAYYADYRRAEQRLAERPLRRMSALTAAMLNHFDHRRAQLVRERNFRFLHDALAPANLLHIQGAEVRGPMVYPFWTDDRSLRSRLLAQRIYTATYWAEVRSRPSATALERQLVDELVPLPVDHRYEPDDMRRILALVAPDLCREHTTECKHD